MSLNRKLRLTIFVFLAISVALTGCPRPVTLVKANASAWIWVSQEAQPQLVVEIQEYARQRSLSFEYRVATEYPWTMNEITMTTPKGNEIYVINATAIDKFSAGITVFQDAEDWSGDWNEFKAYMSARHMWEDVP